MNPLDPNDNTRESSDEPKAGGETPSETPKPRRPRGFAAMDRSKVSEIASKGG
jgi:hypothetical protein